MTTLSRESLLGALESVSGGLTPAPTVQQSNAFAFLDGKVYTYDGEVMVYGPSLLPDDFSGVVEARPLLDLLRKLPLEEVRVEISESSLVVKGKGRRRAELRLEKEIFFPLDSVKEPDEWKPLHPDFAEAVHIVRGCAAKEGVQFYVTCIHVHPEWVEAFDNYQVCRWSLPTGVEESTLVREKSLRHVSSLGMTEFAESESWIHFRNPRGLVLSCMRYVEEYKDLTNVLDVEGEVVSLPKGLAQAAEIAAIFSEDNASEKSVLVEITTGLVRVTGTGASGKYSEGRKVTYQGPDLSFLIGPDTLKDVVARHGECVVSSNRLKIDTGSYVYVTCLGVPVAVRQTPEPLRPGRKNKVVVPADDEEPAF